MVSAHSRCSNRCVPQLAPSNALSKPSIYRCCACRQLSGMESYSPSMAEIKLKNHQIVLEIPRKSVRVNKSREVVTLPCVPCRVQS